jgi:hypothetical protein
MSNFTLLNLSLPEVATLVAAMVQARVAVESRSWSHPQEPTRSHAATAVTKRNTASGHGPRGQIHQLQQMEQPRALN